ncbi:hypothetical protein NL108_000127 [Boleophthalmus pectinirostris]|uniref:interleukin 17a/f3 n=1 Tax=Boleophthalmus pectinirostris TaxID=150288 RepID=UPI000A1C397E|nr:interleukin 17a/f3 [Boleophthalmus pectinirostris]KAJ0060777.1 hypothetical protein NL108_000127 [Boleophthalmus pectinirostris]
MKSVFKAVLLLVLLTPLHCRKLQKVQTRGMRRAKGRTVKLILDPSLSTHVSSNLPLSLSNSANMSLSPWIYRKRCDPSRVPQCLYHAECLTMGCINPEIGVEDLNLEAKPIKYQLLVLHRVVRKQKKNFHRDKKRYDFKLGTEEVSVGCTCVRPNVLTLN